MLSEEVGSNECRNGPKQSGQNLIDKVHDIVDKFNAQDIVEKRSLTIE